MVAWVETGTSHCACDHGRGVVVARAVENTHFSSNLERKRDLSQSPHCQLHNEPEQCPARMTEAVALYEVSESV